MRTASKPQTHPPLLQETCKALVVPAVFGVFIRPCVHDAVCDGGVIACFNHCTLQLGYNVA